MQGNKKCADGFSDTSSIGSVLDDADREVSNLTDRAFRSLCISEDTAFHDSDLSLSPDATRHTNRKSGIWSQLPSQGTEHTGWAATFQQLPKYVQGEEKYPKGSPPLTPAQRRLEVPVSGLRSSSKPISKVSSLIKSFDRTESQPCDSRPPPSKPPALKNPPKFAPLPESGVNFCFDSAFLTVRRVPAEVSSSHQPGRNQGEQETPKNPEMTCHSSSSFLPTHDYVAGSFESRFPSPPHKAAKAEPDRGREWVPKGTFLHSENSAFESWNSHQPKLLERKDVTETIPESKAPKRYEDAPLLREPYPAECNVSPCLSRASCAQEEDRAAPGPRSASRPWGTRDPGTQVFPAEGKVSGSHLDPEEKRSQPPWRKPKASKGGKDGPQVTPEDKKQASSRDPLYSKHNPQGQLPENDALDIHGDLSPCYSPPFNISKLLTPVIPTKQALDPSDTQPAQISVSPPGQLNGYQEKEAREGESRDSYKSKVHSLLFNLKDVRKRVKSTYSPSPLLKGFEEKARGKVDGKQEALSNGVLLPNGLEESPPTKPSKERPADDHRGTQRNLATHPSESYSDRRLELGSPPASSKAPFCVNGEAAERNGGDKEGADHVSELDPSGRGWRPDSRDRLSRKHLSLKLCHREPESEQAVEKMEPRRMENGLSRSVSQETEPEQEAGQQDLPSNQKLSPVPLSPEEEDVFYSDGQSDIMPALQRKAKYSTSSSDRSFASFDDQQKTWFTESQQEDKQKEVRAGESQRDEKEEVTGEDELGEGNGHVCVDEDRPEEALKREEEGPSGGRLRKASAEEANFRRSWMEGERSRALSRVKDPTSSPASTSKPVLFAIKDNTLRATPVIKPIILPLLRTVSTEDSLGSDHREEELPRRGWNEGAGSICAPETQETPSAPPSAHVRGTHLKCMSSEGLVDPGQVPHATQAETSQQVWKGSFLPSTPLMGDGVKKKSPSDTVCEVLASDRKNKPMDSGKVAATQHIPVITLAPDDLEDQPPSLPLCTSWEEQSVQSHLLSAPRAGPPGRRLVPGEVATSPNPSSPGESSTCSPAASSIWDDASQAQGDLGPPPQELLGSSPRASSGSARLTRREDLTHGLPWEAEGSDPPFEPGAEEFRTLSPRSVLPDAAIGSANTPEKPGPPALLERAAAKPPAVPPKTEKALRRAKKLASKRRKSDQVLEKHPESWVGKPHPEDWQQAEPRPASPRERPQPRFPAVRSLPPPVHRHSVSCGPEHTGRRPWGPQPHVPLPPYPATQKVLQDPQSGQYFVFDMPLQVKIKTFYDPETGKYVKVSVPSSEGMSPEEPPLQDALAAPYLLYPGFRPVPVTALMPLRCSSQLAAPTFLRQGPRSRPQSAQDAELQPASRPPGQSTPHASAHHPGGPPKSPEGEGAEAPGLSIISTEDLEDFATEGVS
uniref:cardiac-enriched FHL2-interacting protein n=1 Tax=Jaculus jaculus TaxID=51337 RepID=UPI001E1B05CD|nr:cardiac-enriched FHL2-interacting protein [Jaculus jaculus]